MNDERTRVLFLMPSLKIRGAERMMVNLVNGLDRTKFSIYLVSLSHDNPLASQIEPGAARFMVLPRRMRFDIKPAFQLRKTITQYRITSILAQDIFSFFYIWLALWGIWTKPKVFISIHNSKANGLKDLLKNIVIARLLSGREFFLSVCNSQADYWAATYRIPRKRFLTIYNGIDTDLFCPEADPHQRRMIRFSLKIPDDAFVILQVASLTPEKRHEDSLAALQDLVTREGSKRYYLILVGSGTEEKKIELQQMADKLGISSRVRFCGSQNDVRPYLMAADVFALTSSSEAFSVAALEAMSMGLPCILTSVGGAAEMVVEGMNGYLVEPNNPGCIAKGWLAAFENKDHFDPEKIRTWVKERFSLSDYVHKYESLLG